MLIRICVALFVLLTEVIPVINTANKICDLSNGRNQRHNTKDDEIFEQTIIIDLLCFFATSFQFSDSCIICLNCFIILTLREMLFSHVHICLCSLKMCRKSSLNRLESTGVDLIQSILCFEQRLSRFVLNFIRGFEGFYHVTKKTNGLSNNDIVIAIVVVDQFVQIFVIVIRCADQFLSQLIHLIEIFLRYGIDVYFVLSRCFTGSFVRINHIYRVTGNVFHDELFIFSISECSLVTFVHNVKH